jgi:hypothetical protein
VKWVNSRSMKEKRNHVFDIKGGAVRDTQVETSVYFWYVRLSMIHDKSQKE